MAAPRTRSSSEGGDSASAVERYALLRAIQDRLELPMLVLAFVWIALFVVETVRGSSTALAMASYAIWGLFVLQFAIEFTVAPRKLHYLTHNWLTVLALALPALRVLRVVRIAQVARVSRTAGALRGARLVRVVSSLNRSMRALRATMSRRGFGYVMLLTVLVVTAGAAGMYAFEPAAFDSYLGALWWTAMLVTTIGSQYWPESVAGRVLCLLLSVYGLAMFGYVTATLATFFIGRDEAARARTSNDESPDLRQEIRELREELRAVRRRRLETEEP
jgi:voltage-gated potassium channel